MVKTIRPVILWILAMSLVALLGSCDPSSSLTCRIYNKTSDTVTVSMYKEILASHFKGFTIVENDSVSTRYGDADSISVAVLAPDQVLMVEDVWSGPYREEQVIPLWKYIKSIAVGNRELPAAAWNDEAAWHLKTEGGGRFEGESRYYDLVVRNE